jgi:hypothetical protein
MFHYQRFLVLIPSFGNYSFIRALRAFRALKTLKASPGLRMMTGAIFRSMKGLTDVIVLLLFTAGVFAVIGIEYFSGWAVALLSWCLRPLRDAASQMR